METCGTYLVLEEQERIPVYPEEWGMTEVNPFQPFLLAPFLILSASDGKKKVPDSKKANPDWYALFKEKKGFGSVTQYNQTFFPSSATFRQASIASLERGRGPITPRLLQGEQVRVYG